MFWVLMSYKIYGLQISPPIDYGFFAVQELFSLLYIEIDILMESLWHLYHKLSVFLWASIFLLASWGG